VDLAVMLTRWIALAMPFYLMTSLMIVVLNSFYVFKVPSLRPLVANLFLIVGVVVAVWKHNPAWLGRVYPIAFACFGLLLIPLVRQRWRVRWTFRLTRARGVWSYYLQAFLPLLAFITIQRVNYLADRVISSYLAVGSISALEYSRFVVETPINTLGLGLVQVALPFYSDLSATGRLEELVTDVRKLLQFGFMIMVPLSLFMWIEGEDIIRVLFGYGQFRSASIATTASTLKGFAIGMWAWFCAYFLQRVYNARRKNRQLLLFAAVSLACNIVLNIILARIMGIQGIAVATSVASMLFLSLLVVWFDKGLVRSLSRFLGILLCGALPLGIGLARLTETVSSPGVRIVLVVILGGGGWLAWLWLFSESRNMVRAAAETIRGRFSR
jgi:putative peptidoglycan lipid II flippase